MSKHRLSPAPLPPSKRSQPGRGREGTEVTIDTLYDELILSVFSHLSWADLCIAQATSRNWARLATDNQLWKSLYLQEYGRSRLRGARGFIGRTDGRAVRPLPGRTKTDVYRDWKTMFRISSNWRTGRCTIESLDELTEHIVPAPSASREQPRQTHILLAGNLTITASSRPSPLPTTQIRSPDGSIFSLNCGQTRNSEPLQITALALDQSAPENGHSLRLSAIFSSGRITIFGINHNTPSRSTLKLTYTPIIRNSRTSPIIQAVYHHPLLITLSQAFHLSIYDLSSGEITHRQTLSSFTSFPPTSLVLSTPSSTTYKLVLAYAIPVYPAHWSVGATELIISATAPSSIAIYGEDDPDGNSDSEQRTDTPGMSSSMAVITTRTTRTFDTPNGWIDERRVRQMREQWGRKVFGVADTQTDGKWVVLAPATANETSSSTWSAPPSPSESESGRSASPSSFSSGFMSSDMYSPNVLQLYRLSMPTKNASYTGPFPKLVFVRNLLGPVGAVSSLSVADGRCVGLATNGSVWVWDLETGSGVEVAGARPGVVSKGSVVFDERRIVSAGVDGLVVRRFDV